MELIMKRLVSSTLFMTCLTGLLACSNGQQQAEQTQSTTYPTATIGVDISSIESNPFFQGAYRSFEDTAKEQPTITLLLDSAKDDQSLQLQQLEEMRNKQAKALIVNLIEAEKGKEIVDKYCAQGVILVFFDRGPDEKSLAGCENAYLVQGDSTQAGITQGLQVLKMWEENPAWDKNGDGVIQYAMLEGIPGHSAAVARTKWSIGTMQNYPNIGRPAEKVFQDTANYSDVEARQLVSKWSNDPNFSRVEVILANNDGMALGAVAALKEKGIRLPIFGVDGVTDAVQAIKNGDMAGTVLNDFDNQAKTSLRLAANLVAGEPALSGIEYKMDHRIIQIPYQEIQ